MRPELRAVAGVPGVHSVCNFFLGRWMGPWRAEVNRCRAGEGKDGAWAGPAGEVHGGALWREVGVRSPGRARVPEPSVPVA